MHLIITNATRLVRNLITGEKSWSAAEHDLVFYISLLSSLTVSADTTDTTVLQHITTVSVAVQIA